MEHWQLIKSILTCFKIKYLHY